MSTLSNIRTYERVIAVLIKYGFADVLARTGLDALIAKATLRASRPHEPGLAEMPRATRVRKALEELGPTFMKLGQVLSTRGDLVPKEYSEEFAKLQSDCPTVPWEKIKAKLDHEYRGRTDEFFTEIDPVPVACGTMAQAHFAWLRDGTPVVLKVLRPNIHEQIDGDLHTLGVIAQYAEDHFASLGFSPTGVLREFSRQLRRELDLRIEGRSTARLGQMFADVPGVNFAKVYWGQTTSSVLCIERINARVLARVDLSELSPQVRHTLLENGVRAVLRMCLEEGFFHADPHPGNIMVHDDGSVTFIDCGMCASVTEETRGLIADLVIGVVDRNPRAVLGAALAIGHVDSARIDRRALELETNELVDAFVGVPLEQVDLGAVLQQFFDVLRRTGIQCPPDLVLLIKAISTIQGVGASVDPNFEMVSYARPYLERLVRSRFTTDALKDRMVTSLLTYARTIERLPGDIADIITRIRENRIGVNLDLEGIDEFNENINHASTNIAYALLLAALLLSSAVLVHASGGGENPVLYWLGTVGSFLSFILALLLLVRNFRLDRQARRKHRERRMKR